MKDIGKLEDHMEVVEDVEHPGRKKILAELVADKQAGWVAAYRSLDPTVKPDAARVEGVPMKFIPANTRGDLITRKGSHLGFADEVAKFGIVDKDPYDASSAP